MFLKPSKQSRTTWGDIQVCHHDSNPPLQSLLLLTYTYVLATNIVSPLFKHNFFHNIFVFYKTLPVARIYLPSPDLAGKEQDMFIFIPLVTVKASACGRAQ